MKTKIIALCSSVSFYEELLNIEKELKSRGFKTKIPTTAYTMQKKGNFNVEKHKTWFKDNDFRRKTTLMKEHFVKIVKSDAILVVNNKKHGIEGYIGGNVLMEMVIAFHFKKKIFVLNKIPQTHPFLEEIYGLNSVIIHGDLTKIK